MTEPLDFAELRRLIDALCDEQITAEQMERLQAILLAHTEAEAYYVQYMSLFADLTCHFAGSHTQDQAQSRERQRAGATPPLAHARGSDRGRRILGMMGVLALAASVLLVMLLTIPGPPVSKQTIVAGEASDNTVAVLAQAYRAEWEHTGLPTRVGAALPPGWLRL